MNSPYLSIFSLAMRRILFTFSLLLLHTKTYAQQAAFTNSITELNYETLETARTTAEQNPDEAIATLESTLQAFYGKLLADKKIKQAQFINPNALSLADNYQQDINTRRLRVNRLVREPQASYLVAEAPNLYQYHMLLAQTLQASKPRHAMFHRLQATRYRSLQYSDRVFTDETRLALLAPDDPAKELGTQLRDLQAQLKSAREEEKILEVQVTVAADNRLAQERRAAATVEQQLETNNNNLQQQLENQRAALAAQRQRAQENLDRIRQNRTNIENQLNQLRPELTEAENRYNLESAKLLTDIADNFKDMERNLKEQLRVSDRNSIYRNKFTTGLEFDYSRPRDFETYAQLLEKAATLNPTSVELAQKLGEEFATTRQTEKALVWHEEALRRNTESADKLTDDQVSALTIRAAGLALQTGNRLKAARFYDDELTAKQGQARPEIYFQLAKLHADHLGDYNKSRQLIQDWQQRRTAKPEDPVGKARYIKNDIAASRILARIEKKKRFTEAELTARKAAIDSIQELQDIISAELENLEQRKFELNNAKIPLRLSNQQQDLDAYYEAETALSSQKEVMRELYGLRKSIPLRKLFFEYAHSLEKNQSIFEAREVLLTAERLGIAANEARREIDRLNRKY